jgi:hypothetical protein
MKGLKTFGEKGRKAASREMKQPYNRAVFRPIYVPKLTKQEGRHAMVSLICLVKKREGTVKDHTCTSGSTQHECTNQDKGASPTSITESIIITTVNEAKQRRNITTADVPDAFVQTRIEEKKIDERIIMKICYPLIDMLLGLSPETYNAYVVYEGKSKMLYMVMIITLYRMLKSSLLQYKMFAKRLSQLGLR